MKKTFTTHSHVRKQDELGWGTWNTTVNIMFNLTIFLTHFGS